MSDQDKAEELLQSSKDQKRHRTEAQHSATEESSADLEEAIRDAYHALDDGNLHQNLTIRDENLSALFEGLATAEELEEVGSRALTALGEDGDAETKAGVLKALIRVGLSEVANEEVESAKAAHREYLASQADDF